MCNHNIQFYGEIMKSITQLSSNTLLICATAYQVLQQGNFCPQLVSFVSIYVFNNPFVVQILILLSYTQHNTAI